MLNTDNINQCEEQLKYASILNKLAILSFILLGIGFFLYVFNIIPSQITPSDIQYFWSKGRDDFITKTGLESGWSWILKLNQGDAIVFLGPYFLAMATLISYLFSLVPAFICKKDIPYLLITILQIVVLIFAMTGFFSINN